MMALHAPIVGLRSISSGRGRHRLLSVHLHDRRAVEEVAPALEIRFHPRVIADAPFIGLIRRHRRILEYFDEGVAIVRALQQSHRDAARPFVERLGFTQELQQVIPIRRFHSNPEVQRDGTVSHRCIIRGTRAEPPHSVHTTFSIGSLQAGFWPHRYRRPEHATHGVPLMQETR